MRAQVLDCLPVLPHFLGGCRTRIHLLDVAPALPITQHQRERTGEDTLLLAHLPSLAIGEHIRQEVEQVLRSGMF